LVLSADAGAEPATSTINWSWFDYGGDSVSTAADSGYNLRVVDLLAFHVNLEPAKRNVTNNDELAAIRNMIMFPVAGEIKVNAAVAVRELLAA
jgi:hypothetical protein